MTNEFNIVKQVVMSEKSAALFNKEGKITLAVSKSANKIVIKDAVEKIWEVKVDKVRVINTPGKRKMFGRRPFFSAGIKKAIITLKPGYKIEMPGQFEGVANMSDVPSAPQAKETEGK